MLQLLLCPVLLTDSKIAGALSCLLYAAAIANYCYISFLGYAALPYLDRPETFLSPLVVVLLALPLGILTGVNPTKTMLRLYFNYTM